MESSHGTDYANRYIYKSLPFMAIQFCMFLSIVFAAIVRLPPKKHLYGFYTIHAGLIIIFIGSFVTYQSGVDGSIKLNPNAASREVLVSREEFRIKFPSRGKEASIDLPYSASGENLNTNYQGIKLGTFIPFAEEKLEWRPGKEVAPSSRYRIHNDKVSEELFFSLNSKARFGQSRKLGPLNVHYMPNKKQANNKTPVLLLHGKVASYFDKVTKTWVRVTLNENKDTPLPWMGLKLRLLEHHEDIYPEMVPYYVDPVQDNGKIIKGSLRAVHVTIGNHQFWVRSTEPTTFNFGNELVHLEIAKKQLTLPYEIVLDRFKMDLDPGTQTPASFESFVTVFKGNKGSEKHHIFMNNPMKRDSFTFYQASFFPISEELFGSILSVNFDPGRTWKYLGSLLLVLGSILHYFLRRKHKVSNTEFA
ncbi:MAG TPA: cytochrome c biogenesis protein ResB [Bacteriovoracaceae bacterium]|nr:cytochrome c biogenesis protein ResB [Bacteriovoracaceae bacterium]